MKLQQRLKEELFMSSQNKNYCDKAKFSKVDAQTKLNMLLERGHWNKKQGKCRIYPCNICKGWWHITSLVEKVFSLGDNFREEPLKHIEKWEKLINQK